jgi:hypothetical protein
MASQRAINGGERPNARLAFGARVVSGPLVAIHGGVAADGESWMANCAVCAVYAEIHGVPCDAALAGRFDRPTPIPASE